MLGYHGVLSAQPEHGGLVTRPTPDRAVDLGAPPTHQASSRPRASIRGRLYLGPLETNCLDSTTGNVQALIVADIIAAAKVLASESALWCVWSRTYQTATPVTGGWVDLEFGIQRRRRDKVPTRTLYTVP